MLCSVNHPQPTSSNVKQCQATQRNTMQLKELQSAVKELEASLPDAITPYRMMKITNTLLSTNLPPQMFYNYVAHGYISASTVNIDGKTVKTVKRSEVIRWITKYAIQNVISEF